jgi:hypothetical protein
MRRSVQHGITAVTEVESKSMANRLSESTTENVDPTVTVKIPRPTDLPAQVSFLFDGHTGLEERTIHEPDDVRPIECLQRRFLRLGLTGLVMNDQE